MTRPSPLFFFCLEVSHWYREKALPSVVRVRLSLSKVVLHWSSQDNACFRKDEKSSNKSKEMKFFFFFETNEFLFVRCYWFHPHLLEAGLWHSSQVVKAWSIKCLDWVGVCVRPIFADLGEREVDSSFSLNWARPFPVPCRCQIILWVSARLLSSSNAFSASLSLPKVASLVCS